MLLTGVVLVHRNQLFRDSLRQLLRNLRYSVVTEGVSLGAVLASGTLPDQVEIAIWSSDGLAGSQNGEIGLLRRLKEAIPSIRLVALLDGAVDSEMLRLLHLADVDAVLTEDISAEVLERTLDMVMLGQGVFPASMRRLLTVARPSGEELPAAPPPLPPAMASPPPPPVPVPVEEPLPAPEHQAAVHHHAEGHHAEEQRPVALSLREEQVLYCLAKGFPNKLIARKLCLSEATVKVHVKGLLRKIQVANRTQAAIWAHGSYFKADSIAGVSGLD